LTIKFDLHSHSHVSDGDLTPIELIDYAVQRSLNYLALTDHDSVDGIDIAQAYIESNKLAINLIKGVEISALSEFGELHIVGLNIDHTHHELTSALTAQQKKRWARAQSISDKLAKLNVNGVMEWCQKNVTKVVTRTHMAKAIVALGHAQNMQQAFKKYIGKNGKIKIAKDWMTMQDAILLIRQAGGVAVLAHPTRYPLSNRKLSYLIASFAECGGDAIEMAYPSLNDDKISWLKIHREINHLMASSGSDFHYPDLRWTDLGRFPMLDPKIPHVMERLI
jgi:3',5'-nucleoside bisphosphate phosphatase